MIGRTAGTTSSSGAPTDRRTVGSASSGSHVDREGRETERRVDPYRLVRMGPRWYLVARDVDREAFTRGQTPREHTWRTLRVDRIGEVRTTRHPVEIVDPPDPVALVQRGNAVAPYPVQATVRLPVGLARAQALMPRTTAVHRSEGPDATLVEVGGGSVDGVARWLAGLGVPVSILDPPELAAALRAHAEGLLEANPEDPTGPEDPRTRPGRPRSQTRRRT